MEYQRGRVAITLPTTVSIHRAERCIEQSPQLGAFAESLEVGRPHGRIHVGHARTLLLGQLICRELGIPYHVRIDNDPFDRDRHMTTALLDLMLCLQYLQIVPDKTYWAPMKPYPKTYYADRLGAEAARNLDEAFQETGRSYVYLAIVMDDVLEHRKSLMIRGADFAHYEYSATVRERRAPADQLYKVREEVFDKRDQRERAIFEACGEERYQIFLPLILAQTAVKFSKSGLLIPWDLLTSIPPDAARRFLLATTMNPDDPLSAINAEFSLGKLTKLPYLWTWDVWADLVRYSGECDV